MAAIRPTSVAVRNYRVRSVTAQASTGQTDWVKVPRWAKFVRVLTNVTATAGTTPICTTSLLTADPITADDTNTAILGTAVTGGITSTGLFVIEYGPGITGIADVVAEAVSGGSTAHMNGVLPQLLGIKVLNDRTTGNETYTYTVTVEFE